jgi:hypothetical protein
MAGKGPGVAAVVAELRELPPEEGWTVMSAIYARIDPVSLREDVAKAFQGSGHRYEIRVLDLAANDVDAERARETREWLGRYAFREFKQKPGDVADYTAWADAHRLQSVPEAVGSSAREWVERLRGLAGSPLQKALRSGKRLFAAPPPGVAEALRGSGLLELLDEWRSRKEVTYEQAHASLAWLGAFGVDDATVLAHARSALERPEAHGWGLRKAAYELLASKAPPDAVDLLLKAFVEAPEKRDWWEIAQGMDTLRDPRALPVMVGMILADNTYDSVYGIGYFGLSKWLKVSYEASHDARWWGTWWTEHQADLPPAVRGASIPRLTPRAR